MSDRVKVGVEGHVATVTLSRADKHNGLDAGMFLGLVDAAADVARTPGVRAVVLHGDGPSFCAGLDVAAMMGPDSPLSFEDLMVPEDGRTANLAQRVATEWRDLAAPVIAAIHGNCLGGGLQIALGADVRIATADARLSVMEIKWGLIPDMGITQFLPRLVRSDVARELTYTGRVVSGEEAAALGLVTRIAEDPLAEAQALAAEIASKNPDAVQRAKRLYTEAWQGGDEGLALEAALQRQVLGTPNQMAAAMAAMTGQPGEFADPAPATA